MIFRDFSQKSSKMIEKLSRNFAVQFRRYFEIILDILRYVQLLCSSTPGEHQVDGVPPDWSSFALQYYGSLGFSLYSFSHSYYFVEFSPSFSSSRVIFGDLFCEPLFRSNIVKKKRSFPIFSKNYQKCFSMSSRNSWCNFWGVWTSFCHFALREAPLL